MAVGIIFVIAAAVAFGIYTVFHQQAANSINHLFGAIVISLTASVLGLIILLSNIKTTDLFSNTNGLIFAMLAGVCALAIDYFALKAYGSGLEITVAGPMIIGGSIAVAVLIGFVMGEKITLVKILSLILVMIGSGFLSATS